jgi:N-acetylglucosamine kinase-like BadF-type ATPase
VPDAAAAWAGALHGRPGVAVVAGTGSIAYGRNAAAAEARAGGWGPLFGDEGGGADLGRRAVAAALRATDGRGPETDLGRLLCRALDLREPAEALGRLPWRAASPSALAALAPLVLKACAAGDAVAAALVGEAAAALGDLAAALFRRLGLAPETARVAGCGGLLAGGGPLREALDRDLRARGVAAGLLFPELPGVGGAVLLAHGAAGGDAAAWRLRAPAGGG